MKKEITAQGVYNALVYDDKIFTLKGKIEFHLGDIGITVCQKDVVGNIIQEWLQGWLNERGYAYRVNSNTQMPPDFFLDPKRDDRNLLEVKAFDYKKSPAFDIADFRMYSEELISSPWMLDVDYLIFGYKMSAEGVVTIEDLWLKKVWEITRRMEKWPLNLQVKKNVVNKIRPGVWYRKPRDFTSFRCLEDFVSAVEHTVWQNPTTKPRSGLWLEDFKISYEKHYKKTLKIPRWNDIAESYKLDKNRRGK